MENFGSILILYENCRITPDKNFKVEDVSSYLSSLESLEVKPFQYIKHSLNLTIKYEKLYEFINIKPTESPSFNYCSIRNYKYDVVEETSVNIDSTPIYYFITNHKFISSRCVELTLVMDTLNTNIQYNFTNRTIIKREHKSRFCPVASKIVLGSPKSLYMKIDEYSEGITPQKYLDEAIEKIEYGNSAQLQQNYYLIYKAVKPLDENDLSNPLNCFLCGDNEMQITTSSTSTMNVNASFVGGDYMYVLRSTSPSIALTYDGVSYSWTDTTNKKDVGLMIFRGTTDVILTRIYKDVQNNNDIKTEAIDSSVNLIKFTQLIEYYMSPTRSNDTLFIASQTKTIMNIGSGNKVMKFSDLDRTDSKIMSIIKLPYPPCSITYSNNLFVFPQGWSFDGTTRLMKCNSLDAEFSVSVKIITHSVFNINLSGTYTATMKNSPRNIAYETKLFHSDFYTLKFSYGQNGKEFLFERFDKNIATSPVTYINFKPSNNITSKLMFKFTNYTYNECEEFGEYVASDRNNQVTLFNNDYLNYMRNGYNYEKEQIKRDLVNRLANGGVGAIGVVSGALSGNVVGASVLLTSTLSQIQGAITSIINSEVSIAQKREQLANQSGSISGADDTDLLEYYQGNRLNKIVYSVNDKMRETLFNLFYYCGYATNEQKIPTHNNRIWFDFLQCDAEFKIEGTINSLTNEIIDDLKMKFNEGVTYLHKNNNAWDFNQEKENWENELFN